MGCGSSVPDQAVTPTERPSKQPTTNVEEHANNSDSPAEENLSISNMPDQAVAPTEQPSKEQLTDVEEHANNSESPAEENLSISNTPDQAVAPTEPPAEEDMTIAYMPVYQMKKNLIAAARENDTLTLSRLLGHKNGIEQVNCSDIITLADGKMSATPLVAAATFGSLEAAKLLVSKGAIVDQVVAGMSAVVMAVMRGNREVLRFLALDCKAKLDVTTSTDMTPLIYAASLNDVKAAAILLEGGVPLDGCNKAGFTALVYAAGFGHISIARYLLSKGASREKALERLSEISEEKHKLVSQFFEDMKRLEELEEALTAERKQLEADLAGPWSGQAKETLPTTCKGIKVSGLRKMEARVEALCLEGLFQEDRSYADGTVCKGTRDFDQLTTTDVVYGYVKSKEVTGIKRLADCPELVDPTDIGIPSLFISHAWKGGFSKLCKEIYAHMKKHELSEETIVWLDVLAVNQHGGPDGNDFSREQNRADVAAFQDVLKTCMGGTVVVCDFAKCDTTTRCWCLYEWDWTMFYHGREGLAVRGLTLEDPDGSKLDVQLAQCFDPEDKRRILEAIVEKHGSTEAFNQKLKTKWMEVRSALFAQTAF